MIRIATVGTSQITGVLADAVAGVDGVQIGTVYSREAPRAAALAATLGVGSSTGDWPGLLADPDIDAVYLASPNAVHFPQARDAIAAGKHVLVEKPAVLAAADWDVLVGAAADAGVVLLEAIRTRYDPGSDAVRAVLPRLGDIRRACLRYEKRSSRYDQVLRGERVNIFDPELGGGALRDLGVYCLHAMVALFGPPDEVRAAHVLVSGGADGLGTILADYPGFLVDLNYSKITDTVLPSVIVGEAGTLTVDEISAPRRLDFRPRTGPAHSVAVPAPANGLTGEVRRFVQLIESGEPATEDQQQTRVVLDLVDRSAPGRDRRA